MYTFIAEDNHESKKEKDINKNAFDDELKMWRLQNCFAQQIIYET